MKTGEVMKGRQCIEYKTSTMIGHETKGWRGDERMTGRTQIVGDLCIRKGVPWS
jgi:hypothetical protein